jgi:hypothetical protein
MTGHEGGDILGGPDRAEHEDELGEPDRAERDEFGGPDPA